MPTRKYDSLTIYRRLASQARPLWAHIIAFLLLSLLTTPLALLSPLPLKIAVDSILGSQPPPAWASHLLPTGAWARPSLAVASVAALVVVLAGLTLLHQTALTMLRMYVGERLVMNVREQLFRHVHRLSLTYHDVAGSSDSVYRIQHDATAIQTLVVESIVPLISACFMIFGMLYVTAQLSLKLALVSLAVCPPLVLLSVVFRPRLRQRWRDAKDLESSAHSLAQETLGSVRVVKAFSREEHEHARFRAQHKLGMSARMRAMLQEYVYALLTGLVVASGTAAVLYLGVRDTLSGDLLLGNLLLIISYLKQLYDPLRTIGQQFASKQKAMASAERVFALLDELPEVPQRPGARAIARAAGSVRFQDVSFAYPGAMQPALRNVTFDVPAGARVGIAGKTGSGKTTLTSLLIRFYDPTNGKILLDGNDIRDLKLVDLRNQISLILQEPVLFATTVAENIAYGRPDANRDEIVAAAQAANAHDFIERLPDGYDTVVGERGMTLSGGERQRIALSRAFLRDSPIVILDEPTSSVDVQTEALIMEAMQRLMIGRTTYMIAHRLGTLAGCDLLLRLDHGRVMVVEPEKGCATPGRSGALDLAEST
jgi:ATP-binding cassette subfamily B protein